MYTEGFENKLHIVGRSATSAVSNLPSIDAGLLLNSVSIGVSRLGMAFVDECHSYGG